MEPKIKTISINNIQLNINSIIDYLLTSNINYNEFINLIKNLLNEFLVVPYNKSWPKLNYYQYPYNSTLYLNSDAIIINKIMPSKSEIKGAGYKQETIYLNIDTLLENIFDNFNKNILIKVIINIICKLLDDIKNENIIYIVGYIEAYLNEYIKLNDAKNIKFDVISELLSYKTNNLYYLNYYTCCLNCCYLPNLDNILLLLNKNINSSYKSIEEVKNRCIELINKTENFAEKLAVMALIYRRFLDNQMSSIFIILSALYHVNEDNIKFIKIYNNKAYYMTLAEIRATFIDCFSNIDYSNDYLNPINRNSTRFMTIDGIKYWTNCTDENVFKSAILDIKTELSTNGQLYLNELVIKGELQGHINNYNIIVWLMNLYMELYNDILCIEYCEYDGINEDDEDEDNENKIVKKISNNVYTYIMDNPDTPIIAYSCNYDDLVMHYTSISMCFYIHNNKLCYINRYYDDFKNTFYGYINSTNSGYSPCLYEIYTEIENYDLSTIIKILESNTGYISKMAHNCIWYLLYSIEPYTEFKDFVNLNDTNENIDEIKNTWYLYRNIADYPFKEVNVLKSRQFLGSGLNLNLNLNWWIILIVVVVIVIIVVVVIIKKYNLKHKNKYEI